MESIAALFSSENTIKGTITIPPGDYILDGTQPISLTSHTTVVARGARFFLPEDLEEKIHCVCFYGQNLVNFKWMGGHFVGHVFDPQKSKNSWPPHANTRAILITTTSDGRTEDLSFHDISSDGLAGAVVTICGAENEHDGRRVDNYARNIDVRDCTFERSGKFMWDYGYLWQITVWPEEHTPVEHSMAQRYFRNDLISAPLQINSGDDRVWLNNTPSLPLTPQHEGPDASRGHDAVCFFGDTLPSNLVRGRQYAVVESHPEYIRIAERPNTTPITFASKAGPQAKLIANLFEAHLALFSPVGSGPGKGTVDLVGCKNITVHNCTLSALGDTMHIQKSRDIVFTQNRITGSRMGAFFLAEFCRNARIENIEVNGTNGSRVMSVEKSCANVTVHRNTFRQGGRGSWINQPEGFVLTENTFENNTTKCTPNPKLGRRCFLNGNYEQWPELYFTTHEPNGRYGDITIRENRFTTGPGASHAISFEAGGHDITITGNIFNGPVRDIDISPDCTGVINL